MDCLEILLLLKTISMDCIEILLSTEDSFHGLPWNFAVYWRQYCSIFFSYTIFSISLEPKIKFWWSFYKYKDLSMFQLLVVLRKWKLRLINKGLALLDCITDRKTRNSNQMCKFAWKEMAATLEISVMATSLFEVFIYKKGFSLRQGFWIKWAKVPHWAKCANISFYFLCFNPNIAGTWTYRVSQKVQ